MKPVVTHPDHLLKPARRVVLGTVALCASSCAWTAAAPQQSPFALMPWARAATLKNDLPLDLADRLLASAKTSLARTPNFMALVRTSALLDGEGTRDASKLAQEDWQQAQLQAVAYRLSGQREHAVSAGRYLATWIGPFKPSFNPIDETGLFQLLLSVDLLRDVLPARLLDTAGEWARPMAQGYLSKTIINGGKGTASNNWHSHRVKLGTAAAFFTGDAALIASAREEFVLQVLRNIDNTGQAIDFNQRDALHYVVYTLEPLLMAATMAAAHGHDWYNDPATDGRLRKALDWLLPYANGTRNHEEFVHSTVDFDRRRANAGVKGYAGMWQRDRAATVYWLACRLDPKYRALSAALAAPAPMVQALYAHSYY